MKKVIFQPLRVKQEEKKAKNLQFTDKITNISACPRPRSQCW
jgi:hypothetical protein